MFHCTEGSGKTSQTGCFEQLQQSLPTEHGASPFTSLLPVPEAGDRRSFIISALPNRGPLFRSMHVFYKWRFLWRQARDQIKPFKIYYFCFLLVPCSCGTEFSKGSQMWTLLQPLNKAAARELIPQKHSSYSQPGFLPERCPFPSAPAKFKSTPLIM